MSELISIILVDDDPDEHLLFQEDLEDAGMVFDFFAFTRADEALVHLRERESYPVLLFTDLSLAGDSALQLISDSRKYLHGGAVGCYSGTHNPELDERCQARGASFYIVKPVSHDAVLEIIADLEAITTRQDVEGRLALVRR